MIAVIIRYNKTKYDLYVEIEFASLEENFNAILTWAKTFISCYTGWLFVSFKLFNFLTLLILFSNIKYLINHVDKRGSMIFGFTNVNIASLKISML